MLWNIAFGAELFCMMMLLLRPDTLYVLTILFMHGYVAHACITSCVRQWLLHTVSLARKAVVIATLQ